MGELPAGVERIVRRALETSVRSHEQPTAGRVARTYLLELDGSPGRVVCKLGGPSVRTGDVVEPLVLELVDETTDLPAPSVLARGTLREDGRLRRWALYEFRDGDRPTPFPSLAPAVRRSVLEETGSILGRLHAAHRFERTGGLARAGEDLCICEPDGLYFPDRGRRLLDRLPGTGSVDLRPVLTHGDLFPDNLLVDADGRVTGLLDWGNAHVSTAGYALARAEMRFVDWFQFDDDHAGTLRTALRRGYRRHRALPPEYPRLGRWYKLLWLVQSGERHVRNALSPRGRRQIRQHVRSILSPTG